MMTHLEKCRSCHVPVVETTDSILIHIFGFCAACDSRPSAHEPRQSGMFMHVKI